MLNEQTIDLEFMVCYLHAPHGENVPEQNSEIRG